MTTFTVWAVQLLHDQKDIEAESPEHAARIARDMYVNNGELDPREVADGGFGVVGVTEWDLWTAKEGEQGRIKRLADFADEALRIMEDHKDWDSDTLENIARIAYDMEVAKTDECSHFKCIRSAE